MIQSDFQGNIITQFEIRLKEYIGNLVAKMKLIPNKALIDGKRIVFCEDSIVRGTQLYDNIQILNRIGAREIHIRVACPTLLYPCEYLNFSISRSALDLAGRKAIKELEGSDEKFLDEFARSGSDKNRAMVENIKNRLELKSLKYQKMEDLVKDTGWRVEKYLDSPKSSYIGILSKQ